MTKIWRLLALATVLVVASSATAQAKIVRATIKTKSVTLAKGDKLVIKLDENASTGFRWSQVKRPPIVRFVSSTFVPSASEAIGASGVRTYTYAPVTTGDGTLTLRYARAWTSDGSTTYKLKISVKQ